MPYLSLRPHLCDSADKTAAARLPEFCSDESACTCQLFLLPEL